MHYLNQHKVLNVKHCISIQSKYMMVNNMCQHTAYMTVNIMCQHTAYMMVNIMCQHTAYMTVNIMCQHSIYDGKHYVSI